MFEMSIFSSKYVYIIDHGVYFSYLFLFFGIARYNPLRESSYLPTHDKLKERGALVNINNKNDEKCFLWSVLASIQKFRDIPSLASYYKRFGNTIRMNGISYPVKLPQIDRFEGLNQNISVNVLAYEDDKVFPVRIT